MVLSPEKYLELTSALADEILAATYPSHYLKEDENGDLRYTVDAQYFFNAHLDLVSNCLTAHGITSGGV